MSASSRATVRARFGIGPWVPGVLLPIAVGVVGAAASSLVLTDLPLAAGLVLSLATALRPRSPMPWLLVATLALGQLLQDPAAIDLRLPVLVLAVHLVIVLTQLARVVPPRSRLQLAALGPAARTLGLVQVPAQALAAVLLAAEGRLQVLPIASTIGGALLVLVAGLLIVPRRAAPEE